MQIRRLISTDSINYKSRQVAFQVGITVVSLIIPLLFLLGSLLPQLLAIDDQAVKAIILANFDNALFVRMSFTFYIFFIWIFIPRAFVGRKLTGEIENIIAIGYSARNIWLAKSITVFCISALIAIPFFIIFIFCYKLSLYLIYHIFTGVSLYNLLFLFILNPALIFLFTLLIGQIQLTTDDYSKSTIALFLVGFVNLFSIFLMGKVSTAGSLYKIIYLSVMLFIIVLLGIIILILARSVTNEKILISMDMKKRKTRA